MGERLLCKQEVIGSIPFTSTNSLVDATVTSVMWRLVRVEHGNEVTEVAARFGRYWFPALAGEKMFDIVNREYEENGSFRCDFSQRKNVIAN